MKVIKFLFASLFLFILASCGKFSDGSSIWQEGLWVIPTLTSIGAVIFFVLAYLSSKSNSTIRTWSFTNLSAGNVPFYKNGYFILSIGCLLATIGIIIWQNLEK